MEGYFMINVYMQQDLLLIQLQELAQEYIKLWGVPSQIPTDNYDDNLGTYVDAELTPQLFVYRLQSLLHLSNSPLSIEQRLGKVIDYMTYNGHAINTMCRNYKETKPLLAALRSIMHFFIALFAGKPLKQAVHKSEAQIFTNKVQSTCTKAAHTLLQTTIDTPQLRICV